MSPTVPNSPSHEDIVALGQSASAKAVASSAAKQAHFQTASSPIPASTMLTTAADDSILSAKTEVSSLVKKVLLLEKEFEYLLAHIQNLRRNLDHQIEAASLVSREQVREMFSTSKSQVYRWTMSGELRATWLDSHPRYKFESLKAFIDSRTRAGRPAKKTANAKEAKQSMSVTPKRQLKRQTQKAKTKKNKVP